MPERKEKLQVSQEILILERKFTNLFVEAGWNAKPSHMEQIVRTASEEGLYFNMQDVYKALVRQDPKWYPIAKPIEEAPPGTVSRLPHTSDKEYDYYVSFVHKDYGAVRRELKSMGSDFQKNSERLKNAGLLEDFV